MQKDKSYYVHNMFFWVISHLPDHTVPYLQFNDTVRSTYCIPSNDSISKKWVGM